jgi:hypothetical protein
MFSMTVSIGATNHPKMTITELNEKRRSLDTSPILVALMNKQ